VRVAGVPADARWAAVRVTSTSNAPARLAAWSSGSRASSVQVGTPIGTTTATVMVPIASDGTIGLSTSMGSARVAAWVVGYLGGSPSTSPAPAPAPKASLPSVPRKVKAVPKRRKVKTRWKAPKSDGGAAITGYRVEALVSARKGAAVAGACTTSAKKRKCTIKGLVKGRAYWMSVSVGNSAGRTWAKRVRVVVR
jgi:Fibronectin type III domain